jgi:hypothetical protein
VAWDARKLDRKHGFNRTGIRMANTAGLNADTYMSGRRVGKLALGEIKNAGAYHFNCSVFGTHINFVLIFSQDV